MQKSKKTSIFSNGLIWFGASISLAEILTGTYFASLGFGKRLAAIILGHLIGGCLMYMAGLIGAYTEKSAMETVKLSFGQKGSLLFSSLNILQLIGWSSIMIYTGASAAESALGLGGSMVWTLIIGALVAVWIFVGVKNFSKINAIAMGALLLLTIVLSSVIFRTGTALTSSGSPLSFGGAVELSAAMPLSWLPLISDYTRNAEKKKSATLVSAGVYFIGSCWMYVIGMGAAMFVGESDIARIMLKAGLGTAALFIVILSTVTTTYLDTYSAGVSSVSVSNRLNEKWAALIATALGTLLAIFAPVHRFESFLYLIGSVFAPMAAILITDWFILKTDFSEKAFSAKNLVLWVLGFIIHRAFMHLDTPVGSTLPVMLIISAICIVTHRILGGKKNAGKIS